ncbi:MAG: Bilirubin oxidase, partial [Polaromonas sp.]
MLKRRQLFQLAGVAAWMYSGAGHSKEVAAVPFRHYPLDPVAAANFQQKLFMPSGSGPFGVLDVVGPLKIRATAASFAILPGPKTPIPSPFLLYQTEHAGKAYQNPILRIESGSRFTASLDNALPEP